MLIQVNAGFLVLIIIVIAQLRRCGRRKPNEHGGRVSINGMANASPISFVDLPSGPTPYDITVWG